MVYSQRKIKNEFITEEKVMVEEIPCLKFLPKSDKEKYPTILYYHGWSSNKEFQRFKANVLASYGYQVLVPDAINHGERNLVAFEKEGVLEKYLLETVHHSIEEVPLLIDYLKDLQETDENRLGVMGTSMGGLISSGVFIQQQIFKTLVVFNGACAWHKLESFDQTEELEKYEEYKDKLAEYDPVKNLDSLNERPLLLLHGDIDTSIPIEAQRYFYEKALDYYNDERKLKFVEVPRMDHYISIGMLESAVVFNKDYLK